jgi:transcriptional regulator with XRE-family HTH domain
MASQDSLAALLKELRVERGKSLRQTARDLGIAPSYLSRIERGERAPSPDLRLRAARYYGVDLDDLNLAHGDLPVDVLAIIRAHPDLIEELRRRYGVHGNTA